MSDRVASRRNVTLWAEVASRRGKRMLAREIESTSREIEPKSVAIEAQPNMNGLENVTRLDTNVDY
jgi:hypothetical protein